jgi:VWFA-related protein
LHLPVTRRPSFRCVLEFVTGVLLIATIVAITGTNRLSAQPPASPPPQTQNIQGAETAVPRSSPSLSVNVRLVMLDVVVTDQAGKPVDGLTAKDFQIFEDGQLQRIRSVEPPSAHTLPPAAATAGLSLAFDPAQPSGFGQSPVDILLFDQLNTHFADSSFARRSLQDYLATQPALLPRPTTLLSLYDNHFNPIQGFTRNRDLLLRTLAAVPAEYGWTLEVNGKADHGPIERLDQSLRALEEIAQSYGRIPGRKNLIWVGGGFPSVDPQTIDGDDLQQVKDTFQHVTNVLLDSHVTLYAVDPTSTAAGMMEVTDAAQMAFVQAAGDSVGDNADPFNAGEDFDKLGPMTGGRVVRGRNDIAQQVGSSASLGANYYTVSYTPSSTSDAAIRYRRIRVVCLRPGLTAATRSGYYSGQTQQQQEATASAAYDLTTAGQGPMPLNGIRLAVEPDTSPGASGASYVIRAAVDGLTWRPHLDGSATASVYVMAVSLDAKNRMLGHTLHGMTANAKPGTDLRDAGRTADFHFTAPPTPKAATLRFIVRDSATGRMGSVDLPLGRR